MQQAKEEVYANRKNDPDEWKNLLSDYQELTKAIRGGATDLDDIDISFKSNVTVKLIEDASMISAKSKLPKRKKILLRLKNSMLLFYLLKMKAKKKEPK